MQLTWHFKHWRELTTTELYEILSLRSEVFVVEQKIAYNDEDGHDNHCYHLFAQNDMGKVVAYCRNIEPNYLYHGQKIDAVWIGRVATAKELRGKGFGKELIRRTIEGIEKTYGSIDIYMSAQAYLKKFYGDFGFATEGEEYIEEGIAHIKMVRRAPVKAQK